MVGAEFIGLKEAYFRVGAALQGCIGTALKEEQTCSVASLIVTCFRVGASVEM